MIVLGVFKTERMGVVDEMSGVVVMDATLMGLVTVFSTSASEATILFCITGEGTKASLSSDSAATTATAINKDRTLDMPGSMAGVLVHYGLSKMIEKRM